MYSNKQQQQSTDLSGDRHTAVNGIRASGILLHTYFQRESRA